MAVFKCKMCEANLEVSGNTTVIKCEYCGTTQTVPWTEGGASVNTAGFGRNLENLIKRGNLSIEDRKWDDAEKYFDRVLDINVEEPRAYIGKLLAENRVLTLEELWQNLSWNSVKARDNYKKAYRFADDNLKKKLDDYNTRWIYKSACAKSHSKYISDIEEALKLFTSIIDYEDSEKLAGKCRERISDITYTSAYELYRLGDISKYKDAIDIFSMVIDHKDSRELIEKCRDAIYNNAVKLMDTADSEPEYLNAKREFDSINGYRDSDTRSEECAFKAEKAANETIYKFALTYGDSEDIGDISIAIGQFESIIDYKDSRIRAEALKGKLPYLKKQAEEAQRREELRRQEMMEKAEREAIQKERHQRIIKLSVVILIILAVVFFVVIKFFVIPNRKYNNAMGFFEVGDYNNALYFFEELNGYKDSENMIMRSYYSMAMQLYEKGDYRGAVRCFKTLNGYEDSESKIQEIFDLYPSIKRYMTLNTISAGSNVTAAVKSNGVAVWTDKKTDWHDIISVSAGDGIVVGLKSDGTIVSNYSNNFSDWNFIADISCKENYFVGLKADGTVIAAGSRIPELRYISNWTDIIAVSAGYSHIVGLKSDGTVVMVGSNVFDQYDVYDWTDIIAVSAGKRHTVGLKADSTVVAAGRNIYGECDVSDWTDIIAVSAGYNHTVGLKSNGTVVAVGSNYDGECMVSEWKNIIAVSAGEDYTIGLKSDGTVVSTGKNDNKQRNVSDWSDIKTTP